MTDKTKPWLNVEHPEFVAADAARNRLCAELAGAGVELVGSGVGLTSDRQRANVCIYVRCTEDASSVPKSFDGHEVVVEVRAPARLS